MVVGVNGRSGGLHDRRFCRCTWERQVLVGAGVLRSLAKCGKEAQSFLWWLAGQEFEGEIREGTVSEVAAAAATGAAAASSALGWSGGRSRSVGLGGVALGR